MSDPKVIPGEEIAFDGSANPQADLVTAIAATAAEPVPPSNVTSVEAVLRDFLLAHQNPLIDPRAKALDSFNPFILEHLIPYLRFNPLMKVVPVPIPRTDLFRIIGKTDTDLAYVLENTDLGLHFPDEFDLLKDNLPKSMNILGISHLVVEKQAMSLAKVTEKRLLIPNQYFLSLFLEQGEVYRQFLQAVGYDGTRSMPYFFHFLDENGKLMRAESKDHIPLTVSNLKRYIESGGERKLAGLLDSITTLALQLRADSTQVRNILYEQLAKYNPQLAVK